MSAFKEAFEERKQMHIQRMASPEVEYVNTPKTPSINYRKLFVFSMFLNLFLMFAVREYWSILGTDEYAIHNLRNNTNLSMHDDYLKRIRRSYCK